MAALELENLWFKPQIVFKNITASLEQPVRTRLLLFVVLHDQCPRLRKSLYYKDIHVRCWDCSQLPSCNCVLHMQPSRLKFINSKPNCCYSHKNIFFPDYKFRHQFRKSRPCLKPLLPQDSTAKMYDTAGVALGFHALLWQTGHYRDGLRGNMPLVLLRRAEVAN